MHINRPSDGPDMNFSVIGNEQIEG